MKMHTLHVDIETRSAIDLGDCGAYRYAEDATVLMLAYAIDDGPVRIYDLTTDVLPDDLLYSFTDPDVIKVAHNANFERTLLRTCLGIPCPPEQWRCTAVMAYANGLPGSLGECARVLGLAEQKDPMGQKLIKMFSMPQKPTKKQPKVWLTAADRPEEWEQFKAYCIKDVEVERAIHHSLRDLPRQEWDLWCIDQHANDTGLHVDRQLVEQAIRIDQHQSAKLVEEAKALTGLANPKSVAQIKKWMQDEHGETVTSLNKKVVAGLADKLNGSAQRMMDIRAQLGKTSVNKYKAIERSVCADNWWHYNHL